MRAATLSLGALLAFTVTAPAMSQAQPRLFISDANAKVLVQRGQEFLPALPDMTLQQSDKIVVLEGGSASLTCGGDAAGTFNQTGIYPAPQCGVRVAAAPPSQAPVTPAPVATEVVGSTTNWGTVAAITGGVALIGLAASVGSGGGGNKPVSP